jgi:hypothetical protein
MSGSQLHNINNSLRQTAAWALPHVACTTSMQCPRQWLAETQQELKHDNHCQKKATAFQHHNRA